MSLARSDPRHGTVNGYNNYGCSCVRCRKAIADYMREYTHRTGRRRPMDVYLAERYPEPVPHGTESRYTYHRCRCDDCRAASADARRRRRAKAAA